MPGDGYAALGLHTSCSKFCVRRKEMFRAQTKSRFFPQGARDANDADVREPEGPAESKSRTGVMRRQATKTQRRSFL